MKQEVLFMSQDIDYQTADVLFDRYGDNPIITPDSWPYVVNATFNPGAVEHDDETLLLVRVEDMRGFSHLTIARSKDGRSDWVIDEEPFLQPDPDIEEEQWGIEDPRIVWMEDREEYAITYVSFSAGGPTVSLATTKDFQSVERRGALLPPEAKDAALFPRMIDNRYVLIHRPIVRGQAHIWMSFSPDLKHWGDHRILLPVRPGWWDCSKVGLGPPPIETNDGWLVLYHGVRETARGSLYRLGLALLDLNEPWKIIRRSSHWVFGPRRSYEKIGNVPAVTFATGAISNRRTRELRMYYGAADSTVCLATSNLDAMLEYLGIE